jgi:hypothetical protein
MTTYNGFPNTHGTAFGWESRVLTIKGHGSWLMCEVALRHVPPFIRRAGEGKGKTRETRTGSPHRMFLIHIGFFLHPALFKLGLPQTYEWGPPQPIQSHYPSNMHHKHRPTQSWFPGAPAYTRPLHSRLLTCKFRAIFLKFSGLLNSFTYMNLEPSHYSIEDPKSVH